MWNHNSHYHNYLLRQLPIKVGRILDVGCGQGLFANKVATRADIVDAIDIDRATIEAAVKQHSASNIYYQQADFIGADLPKNTYDAIVAIASVHHMDLSEVLQKMRLLLRPSGKLLILGLYRETSILDYIYSAISIPLNLIYLNWYRQSNERLCDIAPTRPPHLSLQQITSVANPLIPSCKIRRHLFWRYSLIWRLPIALAYKSIKANPNKSKHPIDRELPFGYGMLKIQSGLPAPPMSMIMVWNSP
jgi:SAM-dependent methyltransferase